MNGRVLISRRTLFKIGMGGGVITLSTVIFPISSRAQAPTITQINVDIFTHGDDKVKGEGVIFSLIRENEVKWVSNHGNRIGDDLTYRNNSKNTWSKNTNPIVLDDRSKFEFGVEQVPNNDRWEASFGVTANNGTIILIRETPSVTFGNRTAIFPNVSDPTKTLVRHASGSPRVYFKLDP